MPITTIKLSLDSLPPKPEDNQRTIKGSYLGIWFMLIAGCYMLEFWEQHRLKSNSRHSFSLSYATGAIENHAAS
jgi:hypothetical protein